MALSDTPNIVAPSGVAGMKFTDETEAINKYTAELKAKGVKTIIVLAHNPSTSKQDGTNPGEELVDIANKWMMKWTCCLAVITMHIQIQQ